MNKGICTISVIPVRLKPEESSEMVTQILFGETFIIRETIPKWAYIEINFDGYKGWIDSKLITLLEAEFENTVDKNIVKVSDKLICTARKDNNEGLIYLLMGSEICNCTEKTFYINNSKYELSYAFNANKYNTLGEIIIFSALQMLNIPYLWGGRSSFGIDCSGLVQTAYKVAGISLPRDSSDQALKGELVESVMVAKAGDIAFFENENGKIIHTGLIISTDKIIHASGYVRNDVIDKFGIFNTETREYSHKLHSIKRVVNELK